MRQGPLFSFHRWEQWGPNGQLTHSCTHWGGFIYVGAAGGVGVSSQSCPRPGVVHVTRFAHISKQRTWCHCHHVCLSLLPAACVAGKLRLSEMSSVESLPPPPCSSHLAQRVSAGSLALCQVGASVRSCSPSMGVNDSNYSFFFLNRNFPPGGPIETLLFNF